ncbi:MAG: hypothetical protein RIS34_2342, partial [Pseudomonadota bacterium]
MENLDSGSPKQPALLFPAMLGLVLGCAVQLQQPSLWSRPVYELITVVALMNAAWIAIKNVALPRSQVVIRVGVLVMTMGLAFGLTGWRASAFMAQALSPALEGRDITVTGMVAAMPQRNETGLRFRLAVESARQGSEPVRLPPDVYLGWYASLATDADGVTSLQRQPPDIQAGERWQFTVRLKAPHGNSNPYGFDYELWLWEQGLQATGYVRAGPQDPAPQRLDDTWQHPVERARQQVRDAIYAQVHDHRSAGLIAALVVGDQNAIDRADWDIFRATGVAHLMSISGLHVTMFAWLAAWLVGFVWRRSETLCLVCPAPRAALVGGVMLATAYAVFSGWGVPSQRTVWMLATVGLLRLSGKRWPWPHIWMLACAVVVMVDPWALLQAGFWLSFVAVGVLFATDGATNSGATHAYPTRAGGQNGRKFSAGPPQGKLAPLGGSAARVAASVGAMCREQWVITLALAPLTLLLFGQVSLVGLLANALAIPWVTLIVTPLAMLGVLFAPGWGVAAWAIAVMTGCLEQLAALPFATVSIAQPALWAGAAAVCGGVLLVMRLPWGLRVLGVPLILPVLLWQAPVPLSGQFELLATDIGQGNAVIVRTASHTLVYDTGPRFSQDSDAGQRVLVPLLRALDLKVDTVMLSHRDSDHVGGALAVLTMQPQAELISSIEDEHPLQRVRKSRRCEAGQVWVWDEVRFEVLHPRADDYAAPGKPNTMSCVLRISSQVTSGGPPSRVALLAGDLESAQEARLVLAGAPLKADVLLVPHHGS